MKNFLAICILVIITFVTVKAAKAEGHKCVSADCKAVAQALYFEARGDGQQGMHAVANVIMNRTKTRGISPRAVVNQPRQFSYHTRKDLSMREKNAADKAHDIAYKATTGKLKDITGGATFFRTVSSGSWKGLKRTVRIGSHHFFKK